MSDEPNSSPMGRPSTEETIAATQMAGGDPAGVPSLDATMLAGADATPAPTNSISGLRRSLIEGDELPPRIGRFTVVRRLGAGGMGVVFACYDETLDRKVALKLLRPERIPSGQGSTGSSAGQARLLREAQALAKLSHPNIVSVYEVGTWEGQVFVAMEYVDGEPLSQWQNASERSVDELVEIYRDSGRGLAAAHGAGLVHRDFKPDNVLVGRDGIPRVLDFGLARAAHEHAGDQPDFEKEGAIHSSLNTSLTQTGAIMGTPAYMAPEQFEGRHTDARTDQFAFCVSVYEALYGERPFAGGSFAALATAVTEGRIKDEPPFSQVPAALRRVLLRGLSIQPSERYPSMNALLAELGRDPDAVRRRRLTALLGAAVVITGATIGASWWRAAGREIAAQRAEVEQAFSRAADERAAGVQPIDVDASQLAVQRDELRVSEAIAMLDRDPTGALWALANLEVPTVMETARVRWTAAAALAHGVAEKTMDLRPVGDLRWLRMREDGKAIAWLDDAGLHLAPIQASLEDAEPRSVSHDVAWLVGTWRGDRFLAVDASGAIVERSLDDAPNEADPDDAGGGEGETGLAPLMAEADAPRAAPACAGVVAAADGVLACGAEVTVEDGKTLQTPPDTTWRTFHRADGRIFGVDGRERLWLLSETETPRMFDGKASGVSRLTSDGEAVHGFGGAGGKGQVFAWSVSKLGLAESPASEGTRLGAVAANGAWITVDADGRTAISPVPSGEDGDESAEPIALRDDAKIVDVGWTPEGEAWTLSDAGRLRLWSTSKRFPKRVADDLHLKGRLAGAGRVVAHADQTGRLRVWTLGEFGRLWDEKPFGDAVDFLAVDPAGRWVAAGTPVGAKIFGIDEGNELFSSSLASGERVQRLSWSTNGDLAIGTCLAGGDCAVVVARAEGGQPRRLESRGRLVGRLLDVRHAVDGRRLVALDARGAVVVWSLESGRIVNSGQVELGEQDQEHAMASFDAQARVRVVRWSGERIELSMLTSRGSSVVLAERDDLRAVTVDTHAGAALFVDGEGIGWAWDLATGKVMRWGAAENTGGDALEGWPTHLRVCDDRRRWIAYRPGPGGVTIMADLDAGARIALPVAMGEQTACGATPVTAHERELLALTLPPGEASAFARWVHERVGME